MTPYNLRIPNDRLYWDVFRQRVRAVAAEIARIFVVETETPAPMEIPWPYGEDERTGLRKAFRNFIVVKCTNERHEYELTPFVYDTLDANHEMIARKIGELLNIEEPPRAKEVPVRTSNPIGEPMQGIPGYFWPAEGDNYVTGETFTSLSGEIYFKGTGLTGPYWVRLRARVAA